MSNIKSKKEIEAISSEVLRFAQAGRDYITIAMPLIVGRSSKTFPIKKIVRLVRSFAKAESRFRHVNDAYIRGLDDAGRKIYDLAWNRMNWARRMVARLSGAFISNRYNAECEGLKGDRVIMYKLIRREYALAIKNLIRKSEILVELCKSVDDFLQSENTRRRDAAKAGFQFRSAFGSFLDRKIPEGLFE